MTASNSGFTAWEYNDITIPHKHAQLYKDTYQNFGWILIEPTEQTSHDPNHSTGHAAAHESGTIVLKFKRDSRLENKHALNRIQRKCDEALTAIQKLEGKKSARKMGSLLGSALIGTVFMALAVYNIIFSNMLPALFFAVVSMIGWLGAFYTDRNTSKQDSKYTPLIDEHYAAVYEAGEKAHALLS